LVQDLTSDWDGCHPVSLPLRRSRVVRTM
jgi:hypothetical protein